MNKHCSIIVLNYNGFEDTIECVHSLIQFLQYNYTILIVDNASTDASVESISRELSNPDWKQVHLIQSDTNGGFSAGNNLGIQYGISHFNSDYFWILNNDTIIKDDALSPLVEFSESNPDVGVVGSKLKFYDQPDLIQAVGGRMNVCFGKFHQIGFNKTDAELDLKELGSLDFVVGASLFVNRQFIHTVGLLSEDYFLYFEEIDWSLRAKKKGLRTATCIDSVVFHKQGQSTKNKVKAKKNIAAMYFQFKNLILVYWKFYPLLIIVPYIVVSLRCLKFALKEDKAYLALWLKIIFKRRLTHFEY